MSTQGTRGRVDGRRDGALGGSPCRSLRVWGLWKHQMGGKPAARLLGLCEFLMAGANLRVWEDDHIRSPPSKLGDGRWTPCGGGRSATSLF